MEGKKSVDRRKIGFDKLRLIGNVVVYYVYSYPPNGFGYELMKFGANSYGRVKRKKKKKISAIILFQVTSM